MGTRNTKREVFLYFGIIEHNLFRRFGGFEERGNNNPSLENNNNNNLPLLLLEFGEDLEKGFNLSPRKNLRWLDPNMVILVNALIEINFRVNHVERESNYIKLIEFRKIEVEDLNEWLKKYNKIIKINK